MVLVIGDERRERHRLAFTRLDPKRQVHGSNFRDANYEGCKVGWEHTHQWGDMMQWCEDNFGTKYAWIGDTFWFVEPDDAFLFRMTWSL